MRRHAPHVIAALLTFTVGFLSARTVDGLAFALPAAFTFFVLAKSIPGLRIDPHYLKAGAITLLLWAALIYFVFSVIIPPAGSCVVDFPLEGSGTVEATEAEQPPDTRESGTNELMGITAYGCEGPAYSLSTLNTLWVGIVDKKAISKPTPPYPPAAASGRVVGTVAVSVVIDEAGKVLWVQSLSGHPVLRQAAMEAACRARFAPTLINGPPIRVSGVLTYHFR